MGDNPFFSWGNCDIMNALVGEFMDEYFFKCQRSFLVNLRHVKRILQNHVVLKNDEEIPISRGMAEKIGKEMIRLF